MIKAALFDLDGVVLDTETQYSVFWGMIGKEYHPELESYFDRVLTSEDFARSKPDPDCYLKGAACFGAKPEECVGLEDSFNGLRAVRASGAFTLGLATTNSREAIAPFSDYVIDDYQDFGYEDLCKVVDERGKK